MNTISQSGSSSSSLILILILPSVRKLLLLQQYIHTFQKSDIHK